MGATADVGNDPVEENRSQQAITTLERVVAAALGVAMVGGGGTAVFVTDNEIGAAALAIIGAFALLVSLGYTPSKLTMGGQQVELERLAVGTLSRVFQEGDIDTKERVREAFEEEVSDRGMAVEPAEAARAMLSRLERYSGTSAPRELYDALLAAGWQPTTPPKSAYIRWVYPGRAQTVSLYQNTVALVAASAALKEFAKNLPGADVRPPKNEVNFTYASDITTALDAADRIKQLADGDH